MKNSPMTRTNKKTNLALSNNQHSKGPGQTQTDGPAANIKKAGASKHGKTNTDTNSAVLKELSQRQRKIVEAEQLRLEKLKQRQYAELQRAVEQENLVAQVSQLTVIFRLHFTFSMQYLNVYKVRYYYFAGSTTTSGANANGAREAT